MASGYGYSGGLYSCPRPCNHFHLTTTHQDVPGASSIGRNFKRCLSELQCYAQTDNPRECRPQSDDYLECLHHPKEIARAKAVQDEFIRKAEATAKEGQKAADVIADGVIVGLGLIQRSKEAEGSK
ncbi:hypothetical protein Hypma_002186 [Hypsizygus marmoreus]|uniref:NADH dehydrogenase [ubiquinone] iron-sulfur protein 5 n=1 Tax=Hypsizygus marmoreus TaxID=39966 RepID=A0A369K5G8_HYPMA|nr:hypothetical protein Hypma_002186 [Hypsizygus marmoreus]